MMFRSKLLTHVVRLTSTIEPIEVSEPPELYMDFGTPQIGCEG